MADPDFLFPPTALPPNDGHRQLAPWEWSATQGMPGTPVNAPLPFEGEQLPVPPGHTNWQPHPAEPAPIPPPEDPYAAMIRAAIQGGPKTTENQSTTTSSQTGGLIDTPEARHARDAANAAAHQEAQLARVQGEQAAQQGLERSAQADRATQTLEQESAKRQAIIDSNAKDVARLTKDLASSRATYQKQAADLDPHRLMNGWRGILGALGSALGAKAAVLGQTQNFAGATLDRALEADFDAQKTRLAAKKEDQTFAQQALVNRRAQFQDEMSARSAAKADVLDVVAARTRAMGERQVGETAKSNADVVAAGFEAQAEQHRSDAIARYAQTKSSNTSTTTQRSETTGLAGVQGALQLQKLKKEADGITSQDESYKNKIKSEIGALGSAIKQSEALDKKLKDYSLLDRTGITQDGKNIDTDYKSLGIQLNRAATGASGRPEEMESQKKLLEGGWSTLSNDAKREQIRERVATIARDKYAQFTTMHPTLQQQTLADLSKSKGNETLVYALTHEGELPPAGAALVEAKGGTTR